MNAASACPHCGHTGPAVEDVTVRSLVLPEAAAAVGTGGYHLCLTPDCAIAYYNSDSNLLWTEQLKVPLWFKQGSHPRYACYCNKVTEEEVERIVRERGLTEMPAIIRLLRDEVQSDCRHRNPFGRCCVERFHQLIAQARSRPGGKE